MRSASWNRRKQRVKHSDFRNASNSGFMANLIRIELLGMVHGECIWHFGALVTAQREREREWFHPSKGSIIRRETDSTKVGFRSEEWLRSSFGIWVEHEYHVEPRHCYNELKSPSFRSGVVSATEECIRNGTRLSRNVVALNLGTHSSELKRRDPLPRVWCPVSS